MSQITRRTIIKRGLQLYVGTLAAGLSACGGGSGGADTASSGGSSAALCADPAQMNSGEANARTAFGYVETSADPGKTCAGCAFFRPTEPATACGACDIFNGGPANAGGYCTSWTAIEAPAAATEGA